MVKVQSGELPPALLAKDNMTAHKQEAESFTSASSAVWLGDAKKALGIMLAPVQVDQVTPSHFKISA